MRDSVWAKNLLFLSLVFGGISMLTIYLMAADRIEPPDSFAPHSKWQSDVTKVANRVDRAFEKHWDLHEIDHAENAPNLLVARRLALGLAGTIPSLEEIREFELQPSEHQVHWWVSRLLEDRRASNHLAERFARALVGVENGPFLVFRRRRFVSWLADEIHANRRYDQLVREILTDEGLWTDTPAVNFYTRTLAEDEEDNRVRVVFIAEGEKARLVQVETGIADMDDIEIISGIEEGAEIITGSYRALTRELKNESDIYLRKEDDKKDKKK